MPGIEGASLRCVHGMGVRALWDGPYQYIVLCTALSHIVLLTSIV